MACIDFKHDQMKSYLFLARDKHIGGIRWNIENLKN